VILISDLHVHRWPEFDTLVTVGKRTMSARLLDTLKPLRAATDYALEHGHEDLVVTGDLMHKMGIIDVESYNAAFSAIRRAARKGLRVWLLRGNHDHASHDGRVHSLEAFSAIPGVVVPKDGIHRVGKIDCAFISYSDNRAATIAKARKLGGDLVAFMHHGFEGAKILNPTTEYVVKEPLSPRTIGKRFRHVYSGHYHAQQFPWKNVEYVGSTMEHTRNDRSWFPKGFLEMTVEDGHAHAKSVAVATPRFVVIDEQTYRKGNAMMVLARGNFVDYKLTEQENAEEVREYLLSLGARGVKTLPWTPPVATKQHKSRIMVTPGMTMRGLVRRTVRRRAGKLDTEALETLMLDIMKEAGE